MWLEQATVCRYCCFGPRGSDGHLRGHASSPRASLRDYGSLATCRAPFRFIREIRGPVVPPGRGFHFDVPVRAPFWTFEVVGPVGGLFHGRMLLCIRLELREEKHTATFWSFRNKHLQSMFLCKSWPAWKVCVCARAEYINIRNNDWVWVSVIHPHYQQPSRRQSLCGTELKPTHSLHGLPQI